MTVSTAENSMSLEMSARDNLLRNVQSAVTGRNATECQGVKCKASKQ